MKKFVYEYPTKVYFGEGAAKEHLAAAVSPYGTNVLLAYGGGSVKKNGIYEQVVSILEGAGKKVFEFSGIMSNPTYAKVQEGAALAKKEHIDLILAVGGGSVIDCCKIVAAQAKTDADLWEMEMEKHQFPGEAIPMGAIALMIKRQDPGPAIYAQTRVGRGGKLFKVYKFRSMYVDAEARGAQWAAGDDPRVTPLGRRLRKSRLDEIPQFWNVVKGDMSLIGPRPERPVFHDEFCKRIDGWEQRLAVRPGITGLAQVEGGYELLPKEKALLDIEYIENRSIRLDLSIVWRTLRTMATGEGAR